MNCNKDRDLYVRVTGKARQYKRRYTYGDYIKWTDEHRWEIIEGKVYNMTPAPSRLHQKVLGNLFTIFSNYLKDKECDVYIAPFDVRFPEFNEQKDEEIENVVQPDLVVVCDLTNLDDSGCRGAPDLVVEVLSPATAQKDLKEKLSLYENKGVKEYWLVHPEDKTVMIFKLNEEEYKKPETYGKSDEIEVNLLGELVVNLNEVFVEE